MWRGIKTIPRQQEFCRSWIAAPVLKFLDPPLHMYLCVYVCYVILLIFSAPSFVWRMEQNRLWQVILGWKRHRRLCQCSPEIHQCEWWEIYIWNICLLFTSLLVCSSWCQVLDLLLSMIFVVVFVVVFLFWTWFCLLFGIFFSQNFYTKSR